MTSPPTGGAPADAGVPVCPRHPQSVTYVKCQRCGRPTCSACQRPASVGVHCVDCVESDRKSQPQPRSEVGMTPGAARTSKPIVTFGIIGICVAVWLGEMASNTFFDDVAFVAGWAKDEPWRFITSGFAHDTSSPLHLGFNMYALYIVGQYLEPMLGRVRFAALFLLSVLGGSVGYLLLASPPATVSDISSSGWWTPLVGASGGVFGLFLAIVVFNRHLNREITPMLTLIGINVVIGFLVPNVAWQAHLGGAVIGGVAAAVLFALRRRPAAVQYGTLAAMAVLLIVAAYVKYASVTEYIVIPHS